jgi:hypothetical protein
VLKIAEVRVTRDIASYIASALFIFTGEWQRVNFECSRLLENGIYNRKRMQCARILADLVHSPAKFLE